MFMADELCLSRLQQGLRLQTRRLYRFLPFRQYRKSETNFIEKVWSKEELPSVEEDLFMELTKYGLDEQAL